MNNKYNVGDLVEFAGNMAKVLKVNEEDYFFGAEHTYYTYDLEYTDGTGTQKSVMEPAISLVNPHQRNVKKLCECGAWAIHWAEHEHSRWCPAYDLFIKETK